MLILVSILYRKTGESWKSIQCEAANRGNMPCLVAYHQKSPCAFSQELVTSGGNEMQEKDELYRRPGALVSNQNLGFIDQVPNGANHTDLPVTASSLGEHLIEKASRSRANSKSQPAIGGKIDVDPPNCSGENCIYGRKHVPWISFVGVLIGTTVEASPNLRFADFPSDYATLPTVAFVIPITTCITASRAPSPSARRIQPDRQAQGGPWLMMTTLLGLVCMSKRRLSTSKPADTNWI